MSLVNKSVFRSRVSEPGSLTIPPNLQPSLQHGMRTFLVFITLVIGPFIIRGAQEPVLTERITEHVLMDLNLPPALGFALPGFRRLDPPIVSGGPVDVLGGNDRWVVCMSVAGARLQVYRTQVAGTAVASGDLAPDLVRLGEVVQVVVKEDDAILIGRTGAIQVFRLQAPAAGGHVLVGQNVGILPPPDLRITGPGARPAPGGNVDFLYLPAGQHGLMVFDITLPWFPKWYRTINATRRPAPEAGDSDPVVNPSSVVLLNGQWIAVAAGDRRVRLIEPIFYNSWVDVDHGGWKAAEGETVSQIAGGAGRLYAVVESVQGRRLQAFSFAGGRLTARGSLALLADSPVRRLETFGPDHVAGVAGGAGSFVIEVTDVDRLASTGAVAPLDGATASSMVAQFPHLWVNDRPADASHLELVNADEAAARYALSGNAPAGLVLSVDGRMQWTPDETQGGAQHDVGFTRTAGTTTNSFIARLIVSEANEAPVITPVVPDLQTVQFGQPWRLEVSVSDADLPAQILSLATDVPEISVANGARPGAFVLSSDRLPLQAVRRVRLVANDDLGASSVREFNLSVLSNLLPASPQTNAWTEHALPPRPWPIDTIRAVDGRRVRFTVDGGQVPSGVRLSPEGNWIGVPDESAGSSAPYRFGIQAIVAGETNLVPYVVTVAEVDDPPVVAGIPDQTYLFGRALRVPILATDPEGTNRFAYSAIGISGALGIPDLDPLPIDPVLARIDWTPLEGPQPLGSYWVTVRVTEITGDGVVMPFATNGPSSEVFFRLAPDGARLGPVWSSPGPIVLDAEEHQPLRFPQLRVNDPNGGLVPVQARRSANINGLPVFPPSSQAGGSYPIPDWTPGEDAGGQTVVIRLIASDPFTPGLEATNEIQIRVAEAHRPPTWAPVPVQFAQAGQLMAVPLARFVQDTDLLWDGQILRPDTLSFRLAAGNPPAGDPQVSPNGILTWTPPEGTDCNGVTFRVEAVDQSGLASVGEVRVVAPRPVALLPVASRQPDDVRREVWGGLAGWTMAHDLDWLPARFIDEPNPLARCFLKAYRSLSWLGARMDVREIADERPRGAVRFTDLAALPRTAALLGRNHRGTVLWLRVGEYRLEQDLRGVDWDYDAQTHREWRIYHPRDENQRATICMRDPAGRFFQLVRTKRKMPELHLELDWGDTNRLADDRILASSGPAMMERAFQVLGDDEGNIPREVLAQAEVVANELAEELAGKSIKYRMDQVVIADPARLVQAGVDGTFVEPGQSQFCNGNRLGVPIGLFDAVGALEIALCDGLDSSNRPPVLDPVGLLLAAPGEALTHRLRGTDPDRPRQELVYSLDADSMRRGLQVDPASGIVTWAIPADSGCIRAVGTARVTDPFGESDEEAFTILVEPVRESAPLSGLKADREGLLEINRVRGHVLAWLPAGAGEIPPMAPGSWVSVDTVPRFVEAFEAGLGAPIRGAHVGDLPQATLPRTQAALRAGRLTPAALGLRFQVTLGEGDWHYDAASATEWRRYSGPVEITLEDRVLFRLPQVGLETVHRYSVLGNPEDDRVSARSGLLILPNPEAGLVPRDSAVARAFLADLAGTSARLVFDPVAPRQTVNLIDKGFPVTWSDLRGRLDLLSCLPGYQVVRLQAPPTLSVMEGSEVVADLVATPAVPGLEFRLVNPPRLDMRISRDGRFSWRPGEADGGRIFRIRASVTDGISTDEAEFSLVVLEQNESPRLLPVPPQIATTGNPFRLQMLGSDPDLPAQVLTYRLVRGPAGMQVDRGTGSVTWRPGAGQSAGFSAQVEVALSDGVAEVTAAFRVTVVQGLVARIRLRAFDGILAGSKVWWDANANGLPDAAEPQGLTDRDGWAELEVSVAGNDRNRDGILDFSDGRLLLAGGVDVATGVPFAGRLAAPIHAEVISPLTTLVDTLVRNSGVGAPDAQARVRSAFGLAAGLDLDRHDPWRRGPGGGAEESAVHAANAILADTSILVAHFLKGSDPELRGQWIAEAVDLAWADVFARTPSGTPGSKAWVQEIIGQAITSIGGSVDPLLSGAVAGVVGAQNEAKRQAAAADDLGPLVGLQTGSLTETAEAIGLVASGRWGVDDLHLAQQGWQARSLGGFRWADPYGTNASPGVFTLSSAAATVREDGLPILPLTVLRSGGAKGAVSVTLGLTDSAGLLRTNRLVLEFLDGERVRNPDWTRVLAGDATPAPSRTIGIQITSVVSQTAGAVLGPLASAVVTVLDDDVAGTVAFPGTTLAFDGGKPLAVGPAVVRSGGVAGRLLVRVEYLAGNSSASGQMPDPVVLELAHGVGRRIVPMPVLTAPRGGPKPVVILRISLAPGSAPGSAVGLPSEMRVDYLEAAVAAVPLRISGIDILPGQRWRLAVTGPTDATHSVETSPDLLVWRALPVPVTVKTLGETAVSVDLPGDAAPGPGFFRLRTVQGP